MAAPQSVWGIDIGRCALKAVKLRPGTDGKVELAAFEHIEHAKILSQPDTDRPALISEALERSLTEAPVELPAAAEPRTRPPRPGRRPAPAASLARGQEVAEALLLGDILFRGIDSIPGQFPPPVVK